MSIQSSSQEFLDAAAPVARLPLRRSGITRICFDLPFLAVLLMGIVDFGGRGLW